MLNHPIFNHSEKTSINHVIRICQIWSRSIFNHLMSAYTLVQNKIVDMTDIDPALMGKEISNYTKKQYVLP